MIKIDILKWVLLLGVFLGAISFCWVNYKEFQKNNWAELSPILFTPRDDPDRLSAQGSLTPEPEKNSASPWEWAQEQKKLYQVGTLEQERLVNSLNQNFPQKESRLKALSYLRLGTPYRFGCLGEGRGARDPEPVFRLDVTDCTAFVLTNIALLNSRSLMEGEHNMMIANYRPRFENEAEEYELSFDNRLHFTTDRNQVSPFFKDITSEIWPLEYLNQKTLVLNKRKLDGSRLIDIDWQKQTELTYLPNESLSKNVLHLLPETVGVAFVNKDYFEIGLDVAHEGFLFGGHQLVHASSEHEEVVAVDFWDYYFSPESPPRFDGIVVFDPLGEKQPSD